MSIAQLQRRDLILFDLDGTLVDSAADLYRAMNISLEKLHFPVVTEDQIRAWVGKGAAKLCETVLEYLFEDASPQQHALLLNTFVDVYAQELCVNTQVYEGVLPFLDYCQAHGIIMACVTNKPEQLARGILDILSLSSYFKMVVGGDTLPERKPHPLPLLHCMQSQNVAAAQTLMIGDSSNDVEAARRAGIDCIVVSYGYNHGENIYDCQPQQVVDRLVELVEEDQIRRQA
ncbi:Phosphoglycolate phosphatase [Acinetobacter haemolyticus CIP 64.3 = MTCC 9819]|uniref:phosphoglycolate phosphatase n=2 Tax=Acinetobacter haemolyticus TaxID=29430 RepID=D4XLT8_ACIHA|nr:phosphoglycolate phosphatase [Acinetobacter haemolyticus]EFF83848.1 phosphoglycolate phosphatase, bacterial [Acinetobacter haemolyticus ATCC 19194]ENW16317.1 phosphoglycolate phosphatase, bacterial [Acinetobacter haemolyticus CIP 64.3 = MTCC 9819]EPR87669.1 Phosphoglycolate phosphatase [Acinetobacter haemolyticus CIP 64.3 = MTCC 9819]QXZ27260.1 phosphoglycolate phosphatase [Acinetobacter haemolyticus]SPT48187.1 gph [Acinetobacter haemolyticus]